jgi:hypothetical protein
MKIVISCAGSKAELAGYMQSCDGKRVIFVAQPKLAPQADNVIYAAPDDQSDRQVSWRTLLEKYNNNPGNNPLNLYPAYKLYQDKIYKTYEHLVEKFGVERVFILSAGWGMIRADFLTPQYDISFSRGADCYKRRKFVKTDPYFNFLPDDGDGPIVFIGGKDYVPLFCSLTEKYRSRRIVFHSSAISQNDAPGCDLEKCGKPHTNWHYKCAKAFLDSSTEI